MIMKIVEILIIATSSMCSTPLNLFHVRCHLILGTTLRDKLCYSSVPEKEADQVSSEGQVTCPGWNVDSN